MQEILTNLVPLLTQYGLKVIGAVAILILGRIAAGLVRRGIGRLLTRMDVDPAIRSFVTSLAYFLVLVFAVLASLAKFGIETTSFVAVLGAAGFAVGFALQGSLSNFAAGVLILVLRPFRVGDFVEAAGVAGTVKSIHLFNTTLHTPDNVQILVPNAQIYGQIIKNFSANDMRRIDLVVGIGYNSSMRLAQKLLEEILAADERILKDPAPVVAVAELADSSVNFVVRPWVKAADYWTVRFDLMKRIKETFDSNGVEIPFPQRTVHLVQSATTN